MRPCRTRRILRLVSHGRIIRAITILTGAAGLGFGAVIIQVALRHGVHRSDSREAGKEECRADHDVV